MHEHKNYYKERQTKFKRITVDLPRKLYRSFQRSTFRRDAPTDSEGVRSALRSILNVEPEGQEKNADPTANPVAG